MAKYLEISSNIDLDLEEAQPVNTSAGAGDAGKIAELDAAGKWDLSMMPTGIGPDTGQAPTSEPVVPGDFVNFWNNGGTANIRKADASTNKPAHGFVKSGFAISAIALVFFEGPNDQVSGATPGTNFLSTSTAGGFQASKPTGSGKIIQRLGVATSSTQINFEGHQTYGLA